MRFIIVGQLYTYLGMLELGVPPIYGLTSEEVAQGEVLKNL